jgi:hypothetical protein
VFRKDTQELGMIRKLLHLLLIAMIVVCPLCCGSGECSSVDECCALDFAAAAQATMAAARPKIKTCCNKEHSHVEFSHAEHSRGGHSEDHPSKPSDSTPYDSAPNDSAPNDHAPCGMCQCICSGAVIDDNDDDFTQLDKPLHDVVVTSDVIAVVLFRQDFRTTLPQDGRVTSGRSLCIWQMSFLC